MKELKTLNLEENLVEELNKIGTKLPKNISTFKLASNKISDLSNVIYIFSFWTGSFPKLDFQINYLHGLNKLENLTLANNACIDDVIARTHELSMSYRIFILSLFKRLISLDQINFSIAERYDVTNTSFA